MQQTGSLRKRSRRNLSKVNGLLAYEYSSANDTLFNSNNPVAGKGEFRISMSGKSVETHDGDISDEIGDTFSPTTSWAERHSRTQFLDRAAMNRLRLLMFLGAASGAFPWKWNRIQGRIELWSKSMQKLWMVQWLLYSLQITCLTPYQLFVFYKIIVHSESYREVFMNMPGIFWYLSALIFNIGMALYKNQIREYINSLLKFNEEWTTKYLLDLDGFRDSGRLLINLSIPINMWQGVTTVIIYLAMPYNGWYLTSYIYPKPWYWLLPGAFQDFMMVGQVLTAFSLFSWVVVAHSNSVNFWLQETHNQNDTGHTSDTLRNPMVAVETYKALQVLCNLFNDCMSPLAIAFIKFHALLGLLPCGFVVIRSMNYKFARDFPAILTYPIGLIVLTSGMSAVLSLPGKMNDLAMGFIHSWSYTKDKPFRRILFSCPALKLKVSSCYVLTTAAFVTFFRSVFEMITNCIITLP